MEKIEAFKSLSNLFKENGFNLFLVGGSVRDYLLKNEIDDLDVCTDALIDDVEKFYKEKARYPFKHLGAATLYYDDYRFDLTTLRVEEGYDDFRHPSKITFVKDLSKDVVRRDFTINALYMDSNLKVTDYVNGVNDINNKLIRTIGDPLIRIKEDPLRILRAIRFSLNLDFEIEPSLSKIMKENISLLNELKKEKINEEIRKIKANEDKIIKKFNEFNISYLLNVIK